MLSVAKRDEGKFVSPNLNDFIKYWIDELDFKKICICENCFSYVIVFVTDNVLRFKRTVSQG